MTSYVLEYGDQRIPYQVAYEDNRSTRIAIHVNPDGSVSVDAPREFDATSIRRAVQKRARWVANHVRDAHQRYAHVRPRQYVSGEQVLYLGRRYMLKVTPVSHKPSAVRLKGNRLEVETQSETTADIKAQVKAWYRVKGRDYFARRLNMLAKSLPWVTSIPAFRLLEMQRQWGSCAPSGEIIINTHLVKAPRDCIDYVLIHELAHLKHHDHGAAFWNLLDTHVEGWRQSKYHLDGLVEVLLQE